eukprot:6194562-Pleurochrysis_carterae.AAC.2
MSMRLVRWTWRGQTLVNRTCTRAQSARARVQVLSTCTLSTPERAPPLKAGTADAAHAAPPELPGHSRETPSNSYRSARVLKGVGTRRMRPRRAGSTVRRAHSTLSRCVAHAFFFSAAGDRASLARSPAAADFLPLAC